MNADASPCPCGHGAAYAACCGRWHTGELHLQAPTAEALMRSRYSAYVRGLGAYLQDTWHPSTRPAETPGFEPGTQWLGLEVKKHTVTGTGQAEVEFEAFLAALDAHDDVQNLFAGLGA